MDWSFHEIHGRPHRGLIENMKFTEEELSSTIFFLMSWYLWEHSNLSQMVRNYPKTAPFSWYPTIDNHGNTGVLLIRNKAIKMQLLERNQFISTILKISSTCYLQTVIWLSLKLQNTSTCSLLYSENDIFWGFSTQRRTRPYGGRDSPFWVISAHRSFV
jgi:hypothetical protein